MTTAKMLSLWQPWASLMWLGIKRNETRSWYTSYRGLLIIHAAKRWTPEQYHYYMMLTTPYEREQIERSHLRLPLGAALCAVNLVDCYPTEVCGPLDIREANAGDYSSGRFVWATTELRRFVRPFACKGAQGLVDWRYAMPELEAVR